jgi:hypothetical protein
VRAFEVEAKARLLVLLEGKVLVETVQRKLGSLRSSSRIGSFFPRRAPERRSTRRTRASRGLDRTSSVSGRTVPVAWIVGLDAAPRDARRPDRGARHGGADERGGGGQKTDRRRGREGAEADALAARRRLIRGSISRSIVPTATARHEPRRRLRKNDVMARKRRPRGVSGPRRFEGQVFVIEQ